MTVITRPLDAAVAHALSEITSWAADELAERIAAKNLTVQTGVSNVSCSSYVDVSTDDEAVCVRISNHEAMSYNRSGDWNVALIDGRNRGGDANDIVRLTAIYTTCESHPVAFDEDGDPEEWETHYSLTDDPDADEAEFEGWRVNLDDLIAAIDRAEAFVMRRLNA